MKTLVTLFAIISTSAALSAPLTPTSVSEEKCDATLITRSFNVEAACWKNREGQLRLWFTKEVYAQLKETKISTRRIQNVEEACNDTELYTWEELFAEGADLDAIVTREVEITEQKLDASSCYND
jgi:hypothetical protein